MDLYLCCAIHWLHSYQFRVIQCSIHDLELGDPIIGPGSFTVTITTLSDDTGNYYNPPKLHLNPMICVVVLGHPATSYANPNGSEHWLAFEIKSCPWGVQAYVYSTDVDWRCGEIREFHYERSIVFQSQRLGCITMNWGTRSEIVRKRKKDNANIYWSTHTGPGRTSRTHLPTTVTVSTTN